MIKTLSAIIVFFFFIIYNTIDYFNNFLLFIPNIPESYMQEKIWERKLRRLLKLQHTDSR